MKSLALVVLILAACGGSSGAPMPQNVMQPEDPREARWHAQAEELLGYLGGLVDRACACENADCARGVDDELLSYNQAGIDKPDEFSKDEDERFGASMAFKSRREELQLRYLECLAKHEVPPFSYGVFLLDDIRSTRDTACACTDYACAIEVERAMAQWPEYPMDETTAATAMELGKEAGDCLHAIYMRDGSPDAEQAAIELEAIRDRACACSDDACLLAAANDMKAWGDAHQETRPERDLEARMMAIVEEVTTCVRDLRASWQSP